MIDFIYTPNDRYSFQLPLIKLKVLERLSFIALIDTSIKHNLIDPNFIYFEVDEDYYTCFEEKEYPYFLAKPKMYLFKDHFEALGTHKMVIRNGVKQTVDKLNFNFEVNGKNYSDIFSVVQLNQLLYKTKDFLIDIVLGTDFIMNNNWVIDNKKNVINVSEN